MTRQVGRIYLITLLLSTAGIHSLRAAEPISPRQAGSPDSPDSPDSVVWIDACPGAVTGSAGIWMALDNDKGQLKRQLREHSPILRDPFGRDPFDRSSEGLTLVIHSDGSKSVDLQGRFQTSMMMRTAADGTRQELCTDDGQEAAGFLAAVPATTAPAALEVK
jgi:hypothetical protein